MVSEAERQPVQWYAEQIIPFIDQLRRDGYNIGTGEFVAVHKLLLRLSAVGRLGDDPAPIGRYLAPMLCSNAHELDEFGQRYAQWFAGQRRAPEPAPPASAAAPPAPTPAADLNRATRRYRPWLWGAAALSLVAVFAVVYLATGRLGQFAGPTPLPGQPEPGSELLKQPAFYFWQVAAALATLSLLWYAWWRSRARQYLRRRRTPDAPRLERLRVRRDKNLLFRSVQFFRTAQALRRRYRIESFKLDIPATIENSIRSGGHFSPVYGFRQVMPEYLVLIDRSTFVDHQTRYIEDLIRRLRDYEVYLNCYYFFRDPRLCYPPEADRDPLNLDQLAIRHPNHRLLIFSDGKGLIDGMTGKGADWLYLFDPWPQRAVMTLETRNNRLGVEASLAAAGFMVLPAGEAGVKAFIHKVRYNRFPAADHQDLGGRYPELLLRRPERWSDRHEPSGDTVAALMEQLRRFLGTGGFHWLAACAVYPEIRYDLTLFFGCRLMLEDDRPLFSEGGLRALAQLPWFRQGRMPDWLRNRLIGQVSPSRIRDIRRLLHALLLSSREAGEDAFELIYATLRQKGLRTFQKQLFRKIRRDARRQSPFHDHIFITFMDDPLSVRIPRQLQQMLRARAAGKRRAVMDPAAGAVAFARPGVPAAIGLTAAALLAAVTNLRFESFAFDGRLFQILLACIAGYRYGPRFGLLAGALFFAPNLLLHVAVSVLHLAIPGDIKQRTVFEGIIRLNDYRSLLTLSPIGYLLHAGLGYGAALFKAAVPPLRTPDFPAGRGIYLLLLPLYLTALVFTPANTLRIYLNELAGLLLLLVAFHRGLTPAFGLLLGYLPLVFVRFSAGAFTYGAGVNGMELLLLITGIGIASQFRLRPPARLGAKSMLYVLMLAVAVLLDFKFRWSRTLTLAGYPFSLGVVFAAGFLFGSRRGFGFGLIWGLSVSILNFYLSDRLSFGGEWWFARLAAPLVGYWAGQFSMAGAGAISGIAVRIFGGLYAFRLYIKLLSGVDSLPDYIQVPAWWLQSVAAAALLVVLLRRFRVFEAEAEDVVRRVADAPEALFKPVNKRIWAALTLAGMVALIRWPTDTFLLRIDLFQYIIVFLIGYRYGSVPGLFCGLLVFLPNLVPTYVFGAIRHGLLFSSMAFYSGQIGGLGILGYLLFAPAGYIAAVLKERLSNWEINIASAAGGAHTTGKVVPGLAVLAFMAYITGFSMNITEVLGIHLNSLIFPILLGMAFYGGFEKALTLFWICLPLALFGISLGPVNIGIGMQEIQVLILLAGLAVAAAFGRASTFDSGTAWPLSFASYVSLAPLALLSAFDITLTPVLRFPGYAIAYGLLFAAGYRFGGPRGFKLGLIWGVLVCIVRYDVTQSIRFGGMGWFPLLAAPIIGYLGGLQYRTGTAWSLDRKLLVFTIAYALQFLVLLRQGAVSYAQPPFFWLQSAMLALLMTAGVRGGDRAVGQPPPETQLKES